ncbi:ral guanine nucleotide dissociation stimulator-like [Cynocephalus volans]|uniref:ral guanine nucleotide dissociation stimulator-like n=1 Tax=Cynocephalus volans TaxID=110931 RepID=UPI002FC8C308
MASWKPDPHWDSSHMSHGMVRLIQQRDVKPGAQQVRLSQLCCGQWAVGSRGDMGISGADTRICEHAGSAAWAFCGEEKLAAGSSENESAQALDDTCRVGTVTAGTLEKLVNHLVPSLQSGDPFFVPAFLWTYRRFATTRQVLDLLFKRYGFFCPDREEDDQLKNTVCSFLGCWLDLFPEDLCQPSDLSSLNQVMAYVLLNVPRSALALRVHLLLTQLEDPEPSQNGAQEEEAESDLHSDIAGSGVFGTRKKLGRGP